VHAVGNLSCVSTIGDLLDEGGVRVDASCCGSGFVGGEPAGLLEFDGYRHGLIEVDCHRCRELAGDLQTLHHRHDVESVGDSIDAAS
jgi:hypothetical protein